MIGISLTSTAQEDSTVNLTKEEAIKLYKGYQQAKIYRLDIRDLKMEITLLELKIKEIEKLVKNKEIEITLSNTIIESYKKDIALHEEHIERLKKMNKNLKLQRGGLLVLLIIVALL